MNPAREIRKVQANVDMLDAKLTVLMHQASALQTVQRLQTMDTQLTMLFCRAGELQTVLENLTRLNEDAMVKLSAVLKR
jgi:chaperonin cofactor prefoldin